MTEEHLSCLIIGIVCIIVYYVVVFMVCIEGDYGTKRKFLFDLIPGGAILRWIISWPRVFKELIQDVVSEFKLLE